ncbi:virion structural protein [Erwinia phage PhiEaH1]|jgi:hypothetical protein|uniref:Virion structural protein n=1 Tax=Erwinia phage PhiEaH1 TaxID=1401669 RepID=W8D0J9_9CAUD|nr:virion structural protein [Erwinia phage PhiEaH1]AGX01943.1 virion structural protein [Erwinia phage PhiEaH1]WBF04867.1 hypothetical protein [Erwinia phage vB_Ea277G]
MSLFDVDESVPIPKPEQPVLNPTPYKGVPVDTQVIPLKTLLTAIEGRRWVVTWFSQVLGGDGETAAQQDSRLAINQQYKRINDLELKVTDPIPVNPTYNVEATEFEARGRANMYPGVIPNPGDMFIADLGDGRPGLFIVISPVEQKTIFTQTTYSIEYTLKQYLTPEDHQDLIEKTVREYYFVRDFLDTGINPLITTEAHEQYVQLLEMREALPQEYLNQYIDREFSTLLVPGFDRVYDPFLTTFVDTCFGDKVTEVFTRGLNKPTVMDDRQRLPVTLFDAIVDLRPRTLKRADKQIKLLSTRLFHRNPYYGGIRYSGLYDVVYPPNARAGDITEGQSWAERGLPPPPEPNTDGSRDIPAVMADGYYILSKAFYDRDTTNLSLLEAMVWQMFDNNTVDPASVIKLWDKSYDWEPLSQFYLLPVLYALIPSAMRGLP